MDFPAKWQVCRNVVSHKYTMESRYPPAKETSWTSIITGNFLQILNLNISAILGRIPLLFTTFWGDQPAGKAALNCLDNCLLSGSFPLRIPWLQVNKNEKAFNFEAVLGEGFDETVSCPKGRFFFTMNIIKDIHGNPQPSYLLSGYKPYFWRPLGVQFDRVFQVLAGGWTRFIISLPKKMGPNIPTRWAPYQLLPVINRVLTPLTRVITSVTQL